MISENELIFSFSFLIIILTVAVAVFLIIRCIEASQLKSYLQKVWNDLEKPRRRSARCEVIAPCLPPSDWNKEVIPNSQMEKSMAEVAVVNALILSPKMKIKTV